VPVRHGWKVLAASVAGESHQRRGVPNQDAHAHRIVPGGVIMVVADGVSSAARAAEGAQIACGSTVAEAARMLAQRPSPGDSAGWRAWAAELLWSVRERLLSAARVLGDGADSGRDFACTLLAAVVQGGWVLLVSVGDGFAVCRRREGTMHVLSGGGEDRGPLDRTATVTAVDALERAVVLCVEDTELDALILATDGLEAAALAGTASELAHPHAGFLDQVVRHIEEGGMAEELTELVTCDPGVRESSADDRTIIVAIGP
jgi:hypothetical protein